MAAAIQQQIQDKRACFRDPDRGYGRKNNIPYLRHPDAHVPLFPVYVNRILEDNLRQTGIVIGMYSQEAPN